MWTPNATDGRKMKVGTLYKYIQQNGFSQFATPTKMSAIFDTAAEYRRKAANANPVKKAAATP